MSSSWQSLILETGKDGSVKVNRINYELGVLQALRDGLRCKEIFVVGANRYRNPEEDLPADFNEQREVYYQALSQTLDASEFIASLQGRMQEALASLDRGIPKNSSVKLLNIGDSQVSHLGRRDNDLCQRF